MLKLQFLTCKKYSKQRSTVKNWNVSKLQFFQCTSTVIPLHIFAIYGTPFSLAALICHLWICQRLSGAEFIRRPLLLMILHQMDTELGDRIGELSTYLKSIKMLRNQKKEKIFWLIYVTPFHLAALIGIGIAFLSNYFCKKYWYWILILQYF